MICACTGCSGCNGVCSDLLCPKTYRWPRTCSSLCACTAESRFVNMHSPCVCVHTYSNMCACAALLLHSGWRSFVSPTVEHLEGCQGDEWLPLYRLLFSASQLRPLSPLPQCPMLHFSFPPPFHFTSASFLYFSSILPLPHTSSSPLLISFFSPLSSCLSYPFSVL